MQTMNLKPKHRKGMSQVLSLIVGAAVLMMTAMTLIFLTQGSLVDLFDDTDTEQCRSAIEARCSIDDEIGLPGSCEDVDITANGINTASHDPGDEVSCN